MDMINHFFCYLYAWRYNIDRRESFLSNQYL